MNQACNQALQNMIDEMQEITPEITGIFIFENNGTIVAKDKSTTDQSAQQFITAFNGVEEKANSIGGLETLTLYGNYGEIHISDLNDLRIATVNSNKGDKRTVDIVTKVLAPSIIRLANKLSNTTTNTATTEPQIETTIPSESIETQTDKTTEFIPYNTNDVLIDDEEAQTILNLGMNSIPQPSPTIKLNETPQEDTEILTITNQLKVAKLKTLMLRSNSIRIDKELITRWEENSGNKRIEEVRIESLKGNATTCKFEAIKDQNAVGRGLIQMSDKTQSSLGVAEGEIVIIKPICKDEK